jgi:hypothetical protein
MASYVTIGKDIETGQSIEIGDLERCGGFYILGKGRTGKSTLQINLALQDIEHGHGLLFIDPRADAINELLVRIPKNRQPDVILLDPTDETHGFSVNVLSCANPKSLKERNITFSSALDIFIKLFPNPQTGALDILLSKYLRNSFYPLIEHQGYTLADISLFLTDEPFRESILRQVSYSPEVVDFWHHEYAQLPRREKLEEIESTLNRLNPLLTRDYTKYMVSQPENTVDFARWMDTRKIVLLRMPAWLDKELRSFIGTILISQLLKAVFLRADNPPQERILFGLYCDEFHLFSSPDFAELFTQTGKFNIMPTVAHQERLGQLKPYDPNLGATLAAPLKVLYSQTVHDSHELAPELAKASPTEIRLERQLAISQEPFNDLLRGHKHPEIHRFVQQRLHPLRNQLDDIQDDIEGERLVKQALLDEAAISRTEQQREAFYNSLARGREVPVSFAELERTKQTLEEARRHTDTLLRLHDSARGLKLSIRSLNTFLTAIMEGRIQPEAGQELFSHFLMAFVPLAAPLPAAVAPAFALYISLAYGNPALPRAIPVSLAAKYQQATHEELYREVEAQYTRRVVAYAERVRQEGEGERDTKRQDQYEAMLRYIMTWKRKHGGFDFTEQRTRDLFQLLQYRAVRTLLTPYFFATFTPPWYYEDHRPTAQIGEAQLEEAEGAAVFIRQYGEGAWVTLTLLNIACNGWGYRSTNYIEPRNGAPLNRVDTYQNLHMLEIPAIAGKEPFSVWQLIRKLASTLVEVGAKTLFSPKLDHYTYYAVSSEPHRPEAMLLSTALQKREESVTPGNWWSNLDEQARKYLIFRACDLVTFGDLVADRTFPQPTLPGATPQHVSAVVTALMMLLLEAKGQLNAAWEQAWVRRKEEFVRECLWKYDGILHLQMYQAEDRVHMRHTVERYLPARILTAEERKTLTDACHKELVEFDGGGQGPLAALADFHRFCQLLREPENHVKGQTAQYGEREVNTYPTQEMINQMAQELVDLPRYTAYAKVIQEQGGVQVVRKWKITTEELPKVPPGCLPEEASRIARQNAIDAGILRPRSAIEAESRRRLAQWRRRVIDSPPPPSEEPPPTQRGRSKPPEPEEPPRKRPKNTALKATKRPQVPRKRGR